MVKVNTSRREKIRKKSLTENKSDRSTIKRSTIITLLMCTLLTAISQAMMKYALDSINSFMEAITSIPLILGLVIFAVSSIFLIISMRNAELSIVYPFISLSFVWITVISIWIFDEHVSMINFLGIASIIIGISLIGQGKDDQVEEEDKKQGRKRSYRSMKYRSVKA